MTAIRTLLVDRLVLSLVGVVVVFVVALAYLLGQVLSIPLTHRSATVTVELAATGGLFEGSAVTYRGVKVGRVEQIRLTGTGAEALVRLDDDGDAIPVDTVAKVRSLSPVGEQYLDFQPRVDHGPFLVDGSVIPATATRLPRTLGSTVVAIDHLLDQIDPDQLHVLLSELSAALAGTGQDVGRLLDQAQALVEDLDRLWPETSRLLDNSEVLLDLGAEKADELRRIADSARTFTAFLRNYDPRLRSVLARTPDELATLRELVDEAGKELPGFLGAAVDFSDLFRAYEPHLRELLRRYAPGLSTLADAVHEGSLHVNLIPEKYRRCVYDTPVRTPDDPQRRPMVRGRQCTGEYVPRGARHAPGPVR